MAGTTLVGGEAIRRTAPSFIQIRRGGRRGVGEQKQSPRAVRNRAGAGQQLKQAGSEGGAESCRQRALLRTTRAVPPRLSGELRRRRRPDFSRHLRCDTCVHAPPSPDLADSQSEPGCVRAPRRTLIYQVSALLHRQRLRVLNAPSGPCPRPI